MNHLERSPGVVKRRRRYSSEFKRRLVEASKLPDQSVAGVALAHGINANQLHRWRKQFDASAPSDFVRLPAPVSSLQASHTVRIELPGGVVVHWPMDRMSEAVVWLRALVR